MKLFSLLFSNKRALIYTAFSVDKYSKVTAKLMEAGIPYRLLIESSPYSSGVSTVQGGNEQYDIYVKNIDKHRATEIVHSEGMHS